MSIVVAMKKSNKIVVANDNIIKIGTVKLKMF